MDNKIYIFAQGAHGKGISGGDRIFIEFAREWSKKYPVSIYLWKEGFKMCLRQKLTVSSIKYQVSSMEPWRRFGFIVNYFARVVEGIRLGLTTKLENSKNTIIYSASEFWMDSLPALILKIRYPRIKWLAAWYQTASLTGFSGSLPYWLSQLPIKPLLNRFADFVLVNNELEKKQFQRGVVVLGAVDLKSIKSWKQKFKNLPKIYDGVFQGRFHPQKGVLELIDIWKIIVSKKPGTKLVMIGDGPLMKNLKFKISNLKLEKNIILTGYLFDGEEKFRIFAQSKLVLHPAIFDSGGMASGEAMAFGLPCIGFNLPSYEYYYPRGMMKVPLKDLDAFAKEILKLLADKKLYQDLSKEALHLINDTWSWQYRARQILKAVLE